MENIWRIILYIVILLFFSLFIIYKDKIHRIIEPYIEKYILKYVPYSICYPVFLFITLAFMKHLQASNQDDFANQLYLASLFIYVIVSLIIAYELMEKFGIYASKEMSFEKFLFQIFLSLISIVLCYGYAYNALYYYDSSSFLYVTNNGVFYEFLQFAYYSFEIMFNTDISEIKADNYFSQGITIIESLTSFLVIVLLIANYENIGNMLKKDKINVK